MTKQLPCSICELYVATHKCEVCNIPVCLSAECQVVEWYRFVTLENTDYERVRRCYRCVKNKSFPKINSEPGSCLIS